MNSIEARRVPLKDAETVGEKFAAKLNLSTAETVRSAPARAIAAARRLELTGAWPRQRDGKGTVHRCCIPGCGSPHSQGERCRDSEGLSGEQRRGSRKGRNDAGKRFVYRSLYLEMDRCFSQDWRKTGLPLLLRATSPEDDSRIRWRNSESCRRCDPWRVCCRCASSSERCSAFGRNRVCAGQPRNEQGLCLGTSRLPSLKNHARVLRQLHQDGQPERQRTPKMVYAPGRKGDAPRRKVRSKARPKP